MYILSLAIPLKLLYSSIQLKILTLIHTDGGMNT